MFHCNYYASWVESRKKPKINVGMFIVDETFKRILNKHEKSLIEKQNILINSLKTFVNDEMKRFNKSYKELAVRIERLEEKKK